MKATTFTVRNVTAGQRNAAGQMVLHTVGDVTVTLQPMTRTEAAEWADITDALNTRCWDEAQFRLTVNGWKVIHPQAGVVGLLFQGAATRVHVEWYDPANEDFFCASWTRNLRNLRHGAAQIVGARQHAGHGLPADVQPEPFKAPTAVRPVWLEEGTQVRYHGSLTQLHDGIFRVNECARYDECDHWDCNGYALIPVNGWRPAAVHVGLGSVTAVAPEAV